MSMDYETIKAVTGKGTGRTVDDLIALPRQHDPFFVGSPADRENAEWFGQLWWRFGYTMGVHLRRMHYQIVSQQPAVTMPNGTPYENTERCWQWLLIAASDARYLGAVRFDALVDHRNPPPTVYLVSKPEGPVEIHTTVDTRLQFGAALPVLTFPEWVAWPEFVIENYKGEQRYHLEIWAEKSTQNDILLPLCEGYHVTLMTGLGELSITQIHEAAERMQREAAGKPVRIFYLSDSDPAGGCMPVSAARKLEYQVRERWLSWDPRPDIQLVQIALTAEQCQAYDLPRTPIKDTEKRGERWEGRHGAGATELDALEALRPGTLAATVRKQIRRYRDAHLDSRVWEAEQALRTDVDAVRHAVLEKHQEEIDRLEQEYQALRDEYLPRLDALDKEVRERYQEVLDELRETLDDEVSVDDYPVPEAEEANEDGDDLLYAGKREYEEQLAAYRTFQGKGKSKNKAANG